LKRYVLSVFLDLSKAYDTINHQILLNKLQHIGLRRIAFDWFSSYLTNRMQQVAMSNKFSDSKLVNIGVPQGSILGPLLFNTRK